MIYCGIHQANHTAAEFLECLKNTPPPTGADQESERRR